MSETRWLLPAGGGDDAARLSAALGIGLPAAKILWARGYRTAASARDFLHPSLDGLHDPLLMAGLREALERLRRAIAEREKILIYGDYDADGATSVVILKTAIRLAGGDAGFKVPHRIREGYGMRESGIREAAEAGVRLIVSVDTGIRATDAVRLASGLGIDVIVTDHHLPEAGLPPAVAVLNPNRPDCGYPEKNLCGAGVALKLAQALLGTLGWEAGKVRRVTESLLKLAAIGTVADVTPLTGENRAIVKHGLEGLREVRNPGLRALLAVSGVAEGSAPSAGQVAFQIAPRLNAAGRMDTADEVIELFLTGDAARAAEIAAHLNRLNDERRRTEEAITREILEECLQAPVDGRFALVFCGQNWHRGVLGIVANRIMERFHRPVFVLGLDAEEGMAQGSGRSIPAFHLLEALEAMPELFERFGGHKYAAGASLRGDRVPEFRERFNAWAAARLTPADLVPAVEIEALLDFREIDDASAADVFALAPFGCGNPAPLFGALDVEVAGTPATMNGKHLRVALRQNGRTITAKAWNFAPRAAELAPGTRLDVAFRLEDDAWSAARGYSPWSVVLRDFRPAAGRGASAGA
jgi:single-stranded-DNA-specific exonuclease